MIGKKIFPKDNFNDNKKSNKIELLQRYFEETKLSKIS